MVIKIVSLGSKNSYQVYRHCAIWATWLLNRTCSSKIIPQVYPPPPSFGTTALSGPKSPLFTRFLDHTQRRTTVGRTPLDEWSARRRDLYL